MPLRNSDKKVSSSNYSKIVNEVSTDFPFSGYMTVNGGIDFTSFLLGILDRYLPKRGRLLDIGCGPLDKTAAFQRFGFECYACDDFSDDWIVYGKNKQRIIEFAQSEGIRLHVFEGNFDIPYPRKYFDVVMILDVIEHLHESPIGILNNAGEFLKPGGLLVITTPNAVNLRKRLSVLRGRTNYPNLLSFYHSHGMWRGHVREYTLDEMVKVIKWAGFEILEGHTFHRSLYRVHPGLAQFIFTKLCRLIPT